MDLPVSFTSIDYKVIDSGLGIEREYRVYFHPEDIEYILSQPSHSEFRYALADIMELDYKDKFFWDYVHPNKTYKIWDKYYEDWQEQKGIQRYINSCKKSEG
jgi:hypothetical protein